MSLPQPSYQLMTPFYQGVMQLEFRRTLIHRYTKIKRIPPDSSTEDEWSQPEYNFDDPITDLPCFYQVDRKVAITPNGIMQVNTPTLDVDFTDDLAPSDVVINIQTTPDVDGSVITLQVGPLIVEQLQQQNPNSNGSMFNQAELRSVEIVPSTIPEDV